MTARRARRGAASLLGALLAAALAGTWLAAWHAARDGERRQAIDRAGGRAFGTWVLAVHRASQEGGAASRLGRALPAVLAPADLRGLGAAVPPGLPDAPGGAFLGTIDDGRGVETAFGVLEPGPNASAADLRAGALAAGLAGVGEVGIASSMSGHLPAIAAAMGRQPAAGALYVTADLGLRYREGRLHRRRQPGRPHLNRMETALDLNGDAAATPPVAGQAVTNAGALAGDAAEASGAVSAGGAVSVAGDALARGDLAAASLSAGQAGAASLAVARELTAGSLGVPGAASAAGVRISGRLRAASVGLTGALFAADLVIGEGFDVAGTAGSAVLNAASFRAGGRLTAGGVRAAVAAGTPSAAISGTVSAGSCAGCK